MSSITFDTESVTLIMDTRIYDLDAVMEAANDFTESCWVNLDSDVKNKVAVSITPKSEQIKLDSLGYEFFNYCLGLMQNDKT